MRHATIDDYRWLYAHGYMPDGLKCARAIIADILERCPGSFLDYGCGRGDLVRFINEKMRALCDGCDPATSFPAPFVGLTWDWIISCDVLEHIPRDGVDALLRDWRLFARSGLLLTIANMPDQHEVNGEMVELHLIQEPAEWWVERVKQQWPTCHVEHRRICKDRFALIVTFA
jgi:SAM-dependent methyltransferase